ncbi:MAG: cytochrome c [Armatimonadetes bacterium]|nr:cytochrome c [Armatimonadota bacterium]
MLISSRVWRAIFTLPGLLMTWAVAAQGQAEQGGAETTFQKLCYSCHNVGGGDKKGPDLAGLLQRRDRAWLHKYIPSPQSLVSAGDPYAIKLFSKYAPEEMPDQILTPEQIDEILTMIERLTASKKTFIPKGIKLRKFKPQDIPDGQAIFIGRAKLAKGGPSCISCHSVAGIGLLGGGTLGPDLTQANLKYTNIELASIIKAPAFPNMSRLFANRAVSDEEMVRLVAFLQSKKVLPPDTAGPASGYLFIGALGAILSFGLAGVIWRGRLLGVRKPLIREER